VGVLWDLVLRGFDVVLVEQAGLASGTSGAFHGLLHSGGRYAGTDPETAAACLAENRILKGVARSFVRETGGLFVRLEEDPEDWEERWLEGCRRVGLSPVPVRRDEVRELEPRLTSGVLRAYLVPDAAVDGFGLLWSLVWSSAAAGARVYLRAKVTGFLTDEAGVRGVEVVGLGGTEERAAALTDGRLPQAEPGEITAEVVVNATGPWARETAALAGPGAAASVPLDHDKGVMVIFNSRLVSHVVNRLRPPADGDILVPHGPVTILGTTSGKVRGPRRPLPEPKEVELLLDEGRVLVPDIDRVTPLRAYAGVRPLLKEAVGLTDAGAGRGGGRGFLLVDHGQTDGLPGLVSVLGGKFTTFRAMAAETGDLVCRLVGRPARCRTAEVGVPRLAFPSAAAPPASAAPAPLLTTAAERTGSGGGRPALTESLTCECELVSSSRLLSLLDTGLALSDARRLCRLGMGGCQGAFCTQRLAGVLFGAGWPGDRTQPRADGEAVRAETEAFHRGRLTGVAAVQWGGQARLSALAATLERLTFGRPGRGGEEEVR
jgi:glycerol-3-phosphate dehydrogenase